MGFIRNTLVVILSTVFFIALLLSNLFLTVTWSLEHETLYPEIQNVAKKTLQEYEIIPEIKSNFQQQEMYCLDHEYYTYNSGEYSFKIPCEIIKKGQNETIEYSIGTFINETYYKDYECEILECIKTSEEPFVLISKKTKDYFNQKFKTGIAISIILLILMLLISEKKHNALMSSGVMIGLSALPLKALKWASSLIDDSIIFELVGIFFSRSQNVFLMMIIMGIIFFLAGITLGIMKYGLKISNWFRKKSKNTEKENQKKNNKNNENDEDEIENKKNLKEQSKEEPETETSIKKKINRLKEKLKNIRSKKQDKIPEIDENSKDSPKEIQTQKKKN